MGRCHDGRYRHFEIDPMPDTSSTRYRLRPISSRDPELLNCFLIASVNVILLYRTEATNVVNIGQSVLWLISCINEKLVVKRINAVVKKIENKQCKIDI